MITLVALLAVTTGAWAQGPWTSGACTVTFSDGVLTVSGAGAMADYTSNSAPWYGYDIKTIVIESGVTSIGEGAFASCYNLESVSIPASVTSIGARAFEYCGLATTAPTVSFAEGSTPLTIGERAFYYANLKSIDIPNRVTSIGEQAFSGCSSMESVSIPASVTSIREEAFWNCGMLAKVYIFAPSLTTYGDLAFDDNADGRKIYVLSDAVDTYKAGWPAYAADIVGDLQPLASGPKVTWTAASKTGTFTMPGGNVTLEPEYYPQAALTAAPTPVNDVPATTDGAIVEAGTVATIGETTTAQGTLMYYVSPSALDDAALLALAADAWTADVPTAQSLAQGQAYVYYYVRGNDSDNDDENFSDGDILAANALTVTIAAEPTYAVTFAEGTQDADKWTVKAGTDGSFQSLPLKGVKAGTKVKLKYDGDRSMLKGVKAVKKAAAEEPVADIVWDSTNISDLMVQGTEQWYVKEDVTLCGNAEMIYATWFNYGDPTHDGIGFNTNESGGYTFVAPTGKAFTKIEMKALGDGGWHNANLGTGWAFNVDMEKQIFTVTWKGSAAASTVDLLTEANDFGGEIISYIAFTLVDAE